MVNGFYALTVGLVVFGLFFAVDGGIAAASNGAGVGGGSNTGPPTLISSTASNTVYQTTASAFGGLNLTVTAQFNSPYNGPAPQISIDGVPDGAAPVTKYLPAGSHTVGCGAVTGWTVSQPILYVQVQQGDNSATCVYTYTPPNLTSPTTVTVNVRICATVGTGCFPVSGEASVYLFPGLPSSLPSDGNWAQDCAAMQGCYSGVTTLSGSSTSVTFNVPQDTTFAAVTVYGTLGAKVLQVNTGTAPSTVTVTYYDGSMSILDGLTGQALNPVYELIIGGILLFAAVPTYIYGKEEG